MNLSVRVIPVDEAIASRQAVRAYLDRSLDMDLLHSILELAARAPSGANMQPWKVHVLGKKAIARVFEAVKGSKISPDRANWEEFKYYPSRFVDPFLARRREVGNALYDCLGIDRRDIAAKRLHFLQNYAFFGAPVGLLFTVSRNMEEGAVLDVGMFMQNIMLIARSRGLDTCPQAAFAAFSSVVKGAAGIPEGERLLCGMAIGYADRCHPTANLKTSRAPLGEWVSVHE